MRAGQVRGGLAADQPRSARRLHGQGVVLTQPVPLDPKQLAVRCHIAALAFPPGSHLRRR